MGRTRLGRGAVEPQARGDEDQGERNDFLRFQEQLLRRKKQKLFLGVSVGNGVRGGLFLQAKGVRITIQMALDKNHEKPLASFEAQGHAAGLNVELESLAAFARP